MSFYARAYVCITYEKAKGKFPWEHHVVWNNKEENVQDKEVNSTKLCEKAKWFAPQLLLGFLMLMCEF